MDISFYWLVLSFAFVHCSNEVTLSCGNNDVMEKGLPGILGKLGATGMKGEMGETGRCDNQTKSTKEISNLSERVTNLDEKMNQILQNLARINSSSTGTSWEGCLTEGINPMFIDGRLINVYCEIDGEDRWLVFQKRFSGEVNFYLDWEAYRNGFGNLDNEFWLGLENIHAITNSASYKLRVDLENWNGNTAYAEYSTFSVGNSNSNFRLSVGGYSGTAGDGLSYHNDQQFSTRDQDNDSDNGSCAVNSNGAWWYKNCYRSSLNGRSAPKGVGTIYYSGIIWNGWGGHGIAIKKVEMKLQPQNKM